MLDLTAIEKPYGLLDHATKAALQAHGGPYEVYQEGRWKALVMVSWQPASVYRVKPQTVKPRAMTATWVPSLNSFVINVTNVNYPNGTTMQVSGVLP